MNRGARRWDPDLGMLVSIAVASVGREYDAANGVPTS
jgi:hypothetical protein